MSSTCLIAESDPFVARLLARFAEAFGMTVVRADVGEEVLALARQMQPDVAIVETELPGTVRGWEAVRALKADQALCQVPVISCSWLEPAQVRGLTGLASPCLRKPDLHYDEFLAALQQAGLAPGPRQPSPGTVVSSEP